MKPGFAGLFKAVQQTVALCEVKPDENVIVYSDTRQSGELVEALPAACVAAGADVISLRTLRRFPETDPPPAAIAAMKAADMVFDLSTVPWFYAECTPASWPPARACSCLSMSWKRSSSTAILLPPSHEHTLGTDRSPRPRRMVAPDLWRPGRNGDRIWGGDRAVHHRDVPGRLRRILREREYVLATRATGNSGARILFNHILPNSIAQAVAYAMSDIVAIIVGVVTLSYLGLDVPPPTPE